jgi:ABC-2 type transport system permease protein
MTTPTALDTRRAAVLAGFFRGWIETRQGFTEIAGVVAYVFITVLYVAVLLLLRGKTMPGTGFSSAAMVLPGLLGFSIIFGGIVGPSVTITANREDGTLLRAKATPNGMLGYLVGKIVTVALLTLLRLVVILVAGMMLVSDVTLDARVCLLLTLTFIVGMVATVPIGVALGSVMKSQMQGVLVPLTCGLLAVASGLFFPITLLPAWLQLLVQAFPVYWIGVGARSAMHPAQLVAAELGGSWRTLEMFGVLGVWTAIGLILAPVLLRRMARRQSGSAVAQVRERIRSKGY